MLVIRMQRTGRKGVAQYRMVVQDSRQTPTSGKFVASLGHYDPHTKEHGIDIEKAKHFLQHGAQPSDRVAVFLSNNGVKMPSWVNVDTKKSAKTKNAEKLRKNRPAEEAAAEETSEAEEVKAEEPAAEEAPASETSETEAPEEEPAEEAKPEKTETPTEDK